MESCSNVLSYVLFVFWHIVMLVISHFGFEGGTLVLNASVPGHCLSFTFYHEQQHQYTHTNTYIGMF